MRCCLLLQGEWGKPRSSQKAGRQRWCSFVFFLWGSAILLQLASLLARLEATMFPGMNLLSPPQETIHCLCVIWCVANYLFDWGGSPGCLEWDLPPPPLSSQKTSSQHLPLVHSSGKNILNWFQVINTSSTTWECCECQHRCYGSMCKKRKACMKPKWWLLKVCILWHIYTLNTHTLHKYACGPSQVCFPSTHTWRKRKGKYEEKKMQFIKWFPKFRQVGFLKINKFRAQF